MRACAALLAAAASAAISAAATHSSSAVVPPYVLFPWLCLERCGDNATAIARQVGQLEEHAPLFTAAAFELYNLGARSTLVVNNLTRVSAGIAATGIPARWAMLSSYPYPPQFLAYMRQVFAQPAPFIAACVAVLKADPTITGFNVDWEPVDGKGAPTPTSADALAYAGFLDTLAKALHAAGPYQLSVAVATWSPIWNLTAIGATDVDFVASMGTYTGGFATWRRQLGELLAAVPRSKAVVGLETTNDDNGGRPFTTDELKERFDALSSAGVRAVGIWRSPIPDNWWPFLRGLRRGE